MQSLLACIELMVRAMPSMPSWHVTTSPDLESHDALTTQRYISSDTAGSASGCRGRVRRHESLHRKSCYAAPANLIRLRLACSRCKG